MNRVEKSTPITLSKPRANSKELRPIAQPISKAFVLGFSFIYSKESLAHAAG